MLCVKNACDTIFFFYINHVCSPDGGNKDIYIEIIFIWVFKFCVHDNMYNPLSESCAIEPTWGYDKIQEEKALRDFHYKYHKLFK